VGLDVRCRDLGHVYHLDGADVPALFGVDLHVRAGETVAVLGPSGSGKSTLLTLLAGLLRPTHGELRIGDAEVGSMSERQLLALRATQVGVVVQNPGRNLLPYGTAEDNIRFAQRSALAHGRTDLPEPRELLGELGLIDLVGRRVAGMSGGEQQRLSVAVGVSAAPGLLLADEPTSQLDSANRDRVVALLHRISLRLNTTILAVTHDPALASHLGRTITIVDGQLVPAIRSTQTPTSTVETGPTSGPAGFGGSASALVADNVRYERAGRVILDGVSAHVEPGEVLALVGPSGSGKSSLLALLGGLERPDGGVVSFQGRPLTSAVPTDFGIVLQGYGLAGMLTAAENVAVTLQARGLARDEVSERTTAALAAVGLADVADHLIEELSGGQQQRVAVARALVIEPRVLLADEMTAELDQRSKELILGRVLEVAARGGIVVLATHDPATAQRCHRQLRLVDGRVF
jgi:ABC-type lipoprotein export system ATPase subunit